MPQGFNYNDKQLDISLAKYFKTLNNNISYIRPNEYMPKIGFQILESQEVQNVRIGDPDGFCALWGVWYVDQRLTYNTYTRKELIHYLIKYIKEQQISYKNMIRNYSRIIINERDKLLNEVGIDINIWINDTYTYEQSDKLLKLLIKKINNTCINR